MTEDWSSRALASADAIARLPRLEAREIAERLERRLRVSSETPFAVDYELIEGLELPFARIALRIVKQKAGGFLSLSLSPRVRLPLSRVLEYWREFPSEQTARDPRRPNPPWVTAFRVPLGEALVHHSGPRGEALVSALRLSDKVFFLKT